MIMTKTLPLRQIATILWSVLISLLALASNSYAQPVKIIVDTDMLTDPEDVNALWLLNTLADRGEAEVLACVVNGHETNRASGAAVDVVNTWFGRPNVPLGAFKGGYPKKRSPFTPLLRDNFPHTAPDDDNLPSALEIYRSVLARQPDKSVVIVSIGFLVNLKDLLLSGPDKCSDLRGAELIRRKVKKLAVMGGKYPQGVEYNFSFGGVGPCTQEVIEQWPDQVPIVFSGWEIGGRVISGKSYKQTLSQGPLRTALEHQYNALARGRESWDELTVLYAVRGLSYQGVEYWKVHSGGCVSIDAKTGANVWQDAPTRNQAYLVQSLPPDRLAQVLEELILTGPKKK
jgi:inosine-uridine nucleoside N-ribohydrolase